jgi:hypothetical protein
MEPRDKFVRSFGVHFIKIPLAEVVNIALAVHQSTSLKAEIAILGALALGVLTF